MKSGENVVACRYVDVHGEPLSGIPGAHETSILSPESFYYDSPVIAIVPWGKLYKKECFVGLRYPVGKVHEDEFVTYKILFACQNIWVAEVPLYGYLYNSEGITKGKTYQYSRCLDKLEALQEQFVYFQENQKSDPARAASKYFIYACQMLYHFDKTRKEEYLQLHNHVKKSFKAMYRYLNRYEKLYFFLLRFSFAPAWLRKHDFEPIQNLVRRMKGIK